MSIQLRIGIAAALIAVVAGCAPPRVNALPGASIAPRQIPRGTLIAGYRKIVFQWEMRDGEMLARGEGVARIASPDSVRLDFFLAGGFGTGGAILMGDSLIVPGPSMARSLVPPRPLLWAALGKFDIPAERDTVARVDAGILRADIGSPARWRASFKGDTLVRLERVEEGRLQEWVERLPNQKVQYRNEAARRSLSLVILRSDAVPAFDPSIWRF